jgi:hypothetical protein
MTGIAKMPSLGQPKPYVPPRFSRDTFQLHSLRYTHSMLFMVIESFKRGDPGPVGERFKVCGRMLPDGVTYQASWIDETGSRCFQIMEAPASRRSTCGSAAGMI